MEGEMFDFPFFEIFLVIRLYIMSDVFGEAGSTSSGMQ